VLHCLDHLILAVADLDGAARCYAALLGRRPSWRGEHPALGTQNVIFRLANTSLELLAPAADAAGAVDAADAVDAAGAAESSPAAEAPPDAAAEAPGGWLARWLARRGEGLLGLAFGTKDAAACARFLAGRGLRPGAPEPGLSRDTQSGAFRAWTRVPLPPAQTRGVLLFAIEQRSPAALLPEASAVAEPQSAVQALDHVVLQSRDAEATRRLYGDGLGLRLALDREAPQWGSRLLFFRTGGATLEVVARLGQPPRPGARDSLWGAAWRVESAPAARARLAGAGFEVSELRDGRKPGTRVFTVRAPTCGVPTLVLQPAPAPRA